MDIDPNASLESHLAAIGSEQCKISFDESNEFIQIPNFLPEALVTDLIAQLPRFESSIHRSFIPKYKKGGTVSRYDMDQQVPAFRELYQSEQLNGFLNQLCGKNLRHCPEDDPHTYALYYYTEPGDHIGFHYDTSYYQGARYTALLGLVDESSCRLECQLFKGDPSRETKTLEIQLTPGMLVFFNGDNVYHRITPLGVNERRIALTLEYLTTNSMNPFLRFVSNMKDSIAYFGFKQVFNNKKRS